MDTQGKRLRWARTKAGYKTASQAARALGIKVPTYSSHENTSRGLRRDAALHYARRFKVNFEWLVTGNGKPTDRDGVSVVAYVGAGAEIYPEEPGHPFETVDPPPGREVDCVAARVRGESMYPMLRDGWLIFWRRIERGVGDECVNQLCIVKIDDGPTLVKTLRAGKLPGLFTLESWNAPPRTDVKLEWAAKVIDIRPT